MATARLPRSEAIPLVPPALGAQSLDTGPTPVLPERRGRRRAGAGRIAVATAGVLIAGLVVTQLAAQRSQAESGEGVLPGSARAAAATTHRPASASGSATSSASGSASSVSSDAAPAGTPSSPAGTRASGAGTGSPRASRTAAERTAASSTSRPSRRAPSTATGPGRSLASALADGRRLGTGVFEFADFGDDLIGTDLSGSLVGAGSASTVLRMTPMTSTRAARVPKKLWTTNQLSLIRVSGATTLSGFTLRGTDQGHLYNGLRISRSTNPRISDVRVLSVPGSDDRPPGETFGINDFHTSGARYSDVEVDGSGISAAAFGTNSSNDVTIEDSFFHDSGHANGATFWQTKNVTVRDTRSVDNHDAAFNFERVSGTVVLDHVTMRGNRLSDLRINTDRSSAVYRIIDPDLGGGKLTIVMTPRYMGHANVQRKSDVHVIVNGVDRTDELVRWVDHF